MFSHYTRKLLWDHYGMGKASCLGCNFHNMHIFKKQMLTPTELMLPCLFPEMVKKCCQKPIWPHRLLYIALWEAGAFLSLEVTSDMCLLVCRLFFFFLFAVKKKMKKGVLWQIACRLYISKMLFPDYAALMAPNWWKGYRKEFWRLQLMIQFKETVSIGLAT